MKIAATLLYVAGLMAISHAAPLDPKNNTVVPDSSNQYVTITTYAGSKCDSTNQGSTQVHDSGGATCVLASNAHSYKVSPGLGGPAGTCGHVRAYYYDNGGCVEPHYADANHGNNQCVTLGTDPHYSIAFECD